MDPHRWAVAKICRNSGGGISKERGVAIITGAAQGIGRRGAELLAQRGYNLALNDLRTPAETRSAAEKSGAEVVEFLGDVSDENNVTQFASLVQEEWGRADVLVNNAGVSFISPAEQVSASDFRRVLAVNLLGPFLLCKAFGEMMLAQRSGSIINVASVAGLVGIADRVAYNASKHGLIGLTRTFAAEWAAAAFVLTRCVPVG